MYKPNLSTIKQNLFIFFLRKAIYNDFILNLILNKIDKFMYKVVVEDQADKIFNAAGLSNVI